MNMTINDYLLRVRVEKSIELMKAGRGIPGKLAGNADFPARVIIQRYSESYRFNAWTIQNKLLS